LIIIIILASSSLGIGLGLGIGFGLGFGIGIGSTHCLLCLYLLVKVINEEQTHSVSICCDQLPIGGAEALLP